MIVRDRHDVDVRQILERDARLLRTLGSCELHGRGARRENRIGQHVEAARLHQHGRMTDPRHGRRHAGPRQRIVPDEIEIGGNLRRGQPRLGRQTIANPLQLPAQQVTERFGDRPDVVVAEPLGRVMGLWRHRLILP